MEPLNGEIIFWLLSLGVLTGTFTQLVMGKKGIGFIPNIAAGGAGTVIMGFFAFQIALPGSLLFGLMGCLSILFLMNVFHVNPSHDAGAKIRQKPNR